MAIPPALTDHLGYWLRHVSNHVSQAFARRMEAQGVTVAEWVCLRALYGGQPLAPSALAADLGLTRGAVSKLEARLIGKGLVARTADPADGRAHRLTLTAEGTALTPRLAALADENDDAFFGELTPEERQVMERVLRRIAHQRRLHGRPLD